MREARFKEEEERAFRAGTADAVTCACCHRLRDARAVIQARIGPGLGVPTFLCGACLDNLARALYRACVKNDWPNWRKKPEQEGRREERGDVG